MSTRSARALGLWAALISLTFVGLARAQIPKNAGRQLGGQVLNNAASAAVGQPAGAAVPGQPGGVGIPTSPGQAVQGMQRQAINSVTGAVTGQPAGAAVPGQPAGAAVPGQPGGVGVPTSPGQALQGMQRQAINSVTGAVTGQPAQGVQGTRYQLPAQFSGSAPGSTISYGGASYVVNADRTISPVAPATAPAPAQPAASAVRYRLPPQFAPSPPGSTVSYGGASYVVNADRTMSPVAATGPPTANAMRYQIPATLVGSAPGLIVTYGGANYIINKDNTMSPAPR